MVSFWRDLVLAQGASLIVNLCGSVGSTGDWWADECSQYWPLTKDEPVIDLSALIRVELIQVNQVCEKLKVSKLHVKEMNDRGDMVREATLTLLHFIGWPD